MKTGLFILTALVTATVAQPHGRHHKHHRRDLVYKTDVVTAVEVVTAVAPTAVVFVDGNGNPISTENPEAPATAPAVSTSVASVDTAPASAAEVSNTAPVSPAAPSSTGSSDAPDEPGSSSDSKAAGRGIAYSPYNGDGSCKTQQQIDSDFQNIDGYRMVRIYGTDCNQTATVLSAAHAKGMKVFAGVYDVTQVNSEIQLIINAAKDHWHAIHTVSIGNEGVNDGRYTVAQAVAAVNTARGLLRSAGYRGKVVTVDTFVAMIANPELCQVSDYAAANCHAFFDGHQTAAQAGQFTLEQAHRVSQACGGKETVITEAGWPWSGASNDAAVPGVANQATAIASLKSSFPKNIILFTAFDDMWKKNTAQTFDAEQFWGILSHAT